MDVAWTSLTESAVCPCILDTKRFASMNTILFLLDKKKNSHVLFEDVLTLRMYSVASRTATVIYTGLHSQRLNEHNKLSAAAMHTHTVVSANGQINICGREKFLLLPVSSQLCLLWVTVCQCNSLKSLNRSA